MLINADLAESFGGYQCNDAAIMPYIHMANIACGFHAGSPETILKTLSIAKTQNVRVGAHPGYADLMHFGRESIPVPQARLTAQLLYQVAAVGGMADSIKYPISYIKAHGALYHDIDSKKPVRESFIDTLKLLPQHLAIILPSHCSQNCLKDFKALPNPLLFEAFADRQYNDQGQLIPRSQTNALLSFEQTQQRIIDYKKTGQLFSDNQQPLDIKFDTLCVHGDTPEAVEMAKFIYDMLPNS